VNTVPEFPFAVTYDAPGKRVSIALAVGVHVILALFLFYGVRWQNRLPEAVEVELVRAVTTPATPAPQIEPRPEPVVVPKMEPKPLAPLPRPDIALKEKPKPVQKETPPPPQPRFDPQEQLKHELEQLSAKAAAARDLAQVKSAARNKAVADYIARIRGKIKGNIVLPPDIKGNPEAIFEVVQLPSGEILSVKQKKSSGHAAWDAAVERAILKSSPLPKAESSDIFDRALVLTFRPLEE